jgi:hypothetical protein
VAVVVGGNAFGKVRLTTGKRPNVCDRQGSSTQDGLTGHLCEVRLLLPPAERQSTVYQCRCYSFALIRASV